MSHINNYAFIDGNNLYLGVHALGWKIDYKKLRTYLRDKYKVKRAYIFLGFIKENHRLYRYLKSAGYILIFKPTTVSPTGQVKGNCDAELVLQAMIDFKKYHKAIIITGDGDFACLVRHLVKKNKLQMVLSPNKDRTSSFMINAARERIYYIDYLKNRLQR